MAQKLLGIDQSSNTASPIPTSAISLHEFRKLTPRLYWPGRALRETPESKCTETQDHLAVQALLLDTPHRRNVKGYQEPTQRLARSKTAADSQSELVAVRVIGLDNTNDFNFRSVPRESESVQPVLVRSSPPGILLYPLAKLNLNTILYDMSKRLDGISNNETAPSNLVPPEQLLSYMPCLCKAMIYLHGSEIKDHDINPYNILVNLNHGILMTDLEEYAHAHAKARDDECGMQRDIISLGFVFVEILSVAVGRSRNDMFACSEGLARRDIRTSEELRDNFTKSLQSGRIVEWLDLLARTTDDLPAPFQ